MNKSVGGTGHFGEQKHFLSLPGIEPRIAQSHSLVTIPTALSRVHLYSVMCIYRPIMLLCRLQFPFQHECNKVLALDKHLKSFAISIIRLFLPSDSLEASLSQPNTLHISS